MRRWAHFRKEFLRDRADLGGGDFVEGHGRSSARIVDLLARGRTVAGSIESRRAQGGQIAAAEGGIRNQVGSSGSASMRTDALVISAEDQLTLDHQPTP